MWHLEPFEQHVLHHREDRRVCADGQRQRRRRDCRKTPASAQDPHRITHLLRGTLKERQTLLGVILLANRPGSAEFQHRLPPGLLWRHSQPHVLLRQVKEMLFHLLQQPLLPALPRDQVPNAPNQPSQKFHSGASTWIARNRAMISAV